MSKQPSAINLYKGLSIYKVAGSSKWYVRVWDRRKKKYLVKSTGEESSIKARAAAQELALSLLKSEPLVESHYTFKHFALKLLHKSRLQGKSGDRSDGYVKSIHWAVQNVDWGLLHFFGDMDVRNIKTPTYQDYIAELTKKET